MREKPYLSGAADWPPKPARALLGAWTEEAEMGSGKNARSAKYRAFGRAVREARARRGLSQETLGFAAGLHRNYVGAVERGEINPTFASLLRISHGLDVALSVLVLLYERNMAERAR